MTGLFAHAGMDVASMLVWFGMFAIGILFIALALRDEKRDEEAERSSMRQIRDVNSLPLNHVREALRQRPPQGAAPPTRPRAASHPAGSRHRHPDGPRLVR
jgi:hypothetical protein